MQPIFTHPQSGLQVYAVNQFGEDFPYTFFDIGKNQPDIGVILHPTNSGPVIFHFVNTSRERAAAYVVATTACYRHSVNVANYSSDTARPPFQRNLYSEPDVIWVAPRNSYALSGMTSREPGQPYYPLDLEPMNFDGLWGVRGRHELLYPHFAFRLYPGVTGSRYPYDLHIGFKNP